jgi:hypothetical protein
MNPEAGKNEEKKGNPAAGRILGLFTKGKG